MDTFKKLRAIAETAYSKIWANRHKQLPGKWPSEGFNERGERDWLRCSMRSILEKLHEEVEELEEAVSTEAPLSDVLKEAGDVAAMAMMVADRVGAIPLANQPKVVCLCGSTRFKDAFQTANFQETMKGHIVLSVGFFHHSERDRHILTDSEKTALDMLHKRKIDLADEILVLNVGQYVGDSTRSEIMHALKTGKPIRYLEPVENQNQNETGVRAV